MPKKLKTKGFLKAHIKAPANRKKVFAYLLLHNLLGLGKKKKLKVTVRKRAKNTLTVIKNKQQLAANKKTHKQEKLRNRITNTNREKLGLPTQKLRESRFSKNISRIQSQRSLYNSLNNR